MECRRLRGEHNAHPRNRCGTAGCGLPWPSAANRRALDDRRKLITGCHMGKRGPLSSAMRDYVVSLYVRGELATLEEGASIAGVARFTVGRWLHAAGVNWQNARLHFLARHRARAVATCEGRKVHRPTKRQQRLEAARAKRQWDKEHAAHP